MKKSLYPFVCLSLSGLLIEVHYLHKNEKRVYCISLSNAFKRQKLTNGYEISWWVYFLTQNRRSWVTEETLFMLCDVIRGIKTRKKKPDWIETELYISKVFRQLEQEKQAKIHIDNLPRLTKEIFMQIIL